LQTEIVHVGPVGTDVSMRRKKLHLSLPQPGTGVAGIIFSDPCFSSKAVAPTCSNAHHAHVLKRLTAMINLLLGEGDAFHFWAMLGNNFYDQDGTASTDFFEHLSLAAKLKPLLTVPGNYDFWAAGAPPGHQNDSLGYGFMQFYGQDTVAASPALPFDFRGAREQLDQPARVENFIFGTHIGDLAFFGYSGAHDWNETEPHAISFCQHVGTTDTITTAVVLGHWYECNEGCKAGMDVPSVHQRLGAMKGCKSKTLLYFAGHRHCNKAVDGGAGFLVGGAGMQDDGCPHFGITVLESVIKGGVRVDYFDLGTEEGGNRTYGKPDSFHQLMNCLASLGFAACRELHGIPLRTIDMFTALDLTPENNLDQADQVGNNSMNIGNNSMTIIATSDLNTTRSKPANLAPSRSGHGIKHSLRIACCAFGVILLLTSAYTGIWYAVAWESASSNSMCWSSKYIQLDEAYQDKTVDNCLELVGETTNFREQRAAKPVGEAVVWAPRFFRKSVQNMRLLRDASQRRVSSTAQRPDL